MSNTKMINKYYIEHKKLNNLYKEAFARSLEKTEKLLNKRWVAMQNNWHFDNENATFWQGLLNEIVYENYDVVKNKLKSEELPTQLEVKQSLLNHVNNKPFKVTNNYTIPDNIVRGSNTMLIYHWGSVLAAWTDNDRFKDTSIKADTKIVPFKRLFKINSEKLEPRVVLFLWLLNKWIPNDFIDDQDYEFLMQFEFEKTSNENNLSIKLSKDLKIKMASSIIAEELLMEDTLRADLIPYSEKMLDDIEQGHWSLWNENQDKNNLIEINLQKSLVARDPKSSIKDGVIAIDFGTKSTVVAYQENNTDIHLMRVGITDHTKAPEIMHYENPTIIEFNDILQFLKDYKSMDGRPFTKWRDLTISHTASSSLNNSKSKDFNTFLSELKQWAGTKGKKLKIKDKKYFVLDIDAFLDIKEEAFNPIEIYAYILGLNINNQRNGIYLNYILSFPVTYELEIRDKIIESFKKGIRKSLPMGLHLQKDVIEKLDVQKGASEPAAYAVVALLENGFDPVGDDRIYYAIFDFGGGTTDFDFGVFYEADEKKSSRYDYTIEHFGAGGDRYLGGENLLELLTYEVFKSNIEKMLEISAQFTQPPETKKFAGSETLLSNSREARLNVKILMEALRDYWEGKEEAREYLTKGTISINITDKDQKMHVGVDLKINVDELDKILNDRIHKGIKTFFEALRVAYSSKKVNFQGLEEINIFLGGNSSKSKIVKELFDIEIAEREDDIKNNGVSDSQFKLFEPIGKTGDIEKPTGKTGVVFGLIKTRKGGRIEVIDHNLSNIDEESKEINFKYYIGRQRKQKFKVAIDRNEKYNKWIEFIDASEDTFEIYYSSLASVTTNEIDISDRSVSKKSLKLDKSYDDSCYVYIRLINSNEFEYVVAKSNDDANKGNYLNKTQRVEIWVK